MMFSMDILEKYRPIYDKISEIELKIDRLSFEEMNSGKYDFSKSESIRDYVMSNNPKKSALYDEMHELDKEVDKMIKEDFGDCGPDVAIPGRWVKVDSVYGNEILEDNYKISLGHFLADDCLVQEMYGCGVKIVAPYDVIGRCLIGKKAGDKFSYTLDGHVFEGTITKVW